MTRKRPGDVLAERYRLEDLLSESGQGRFWRAHDQVLSRAVAIHVIDADDERAIRLMEAARASAQVAEPRLLRVLDIENDGRICYVVNEWGRGTSLDHLLAANGPLPARRAAWIVEEVAAALENAHDQGVAHGRLNPENVLIDTTGAVRLIGFAVDAALYGLGPDRIGTDVVDLAALLHFTLTGKWAGLSESAVPAAPREQHGQELRVLRPRQVRAGVPRPLDDLVDEVLNRPHGRHAGPNTAREIHQLLAGYVGDPSGLADELADQPQMTVVGQRPRPATPQAAEPEASREPDVERGTTDPGTDPGTEPEPTVAGLPVFDDSAATSTADRSADGPDAAWYAPRDDVPAPPPPLEPPPERPLFAPSPAEGGPVRKPRASALAAPVAEPPEDPSSFWPFDATPDDPPVPGRRWFRLGLGLGVLVLLVVAGIVVEQLRDGSPKPTPTTTSSSSPHTTSPSATPVARAINGLTAHDFDPFGNPPAENSDLAPRAVDGDPSTTWRTSTYRQNLGPGGIKSGVGIIADLQASYRVSQVRMAFVEAGTAVSIYVSDASPRTAADLGKPVATVTAGQTAQVAIDPAATGRFVTLWFTSLPAVTGGFRSELAEVSVVGTKA